MADEGGERSGSHETLTSISLDSIALHSTNLLTVLDAEAIIQYESPAIERIYGFDQAELVGESLAKYVHPEDRERTLAAFQRVVSGVGHAVESVEFRHRQADDTYLWVESVASSDPTPDGHYVVNTRDISAAKQHQRQLEQTNDRLEAFASVLSHDIRNPLTVAQLRLQLAAEDCNSDHLQAVAQAHDRIEGIITNMLALSRAGQQIGETEAVDLGGLVLDCWESVSTGQSTVTVDVDARIRADPSRLRQLLENLFRNSIDHSEGNVSVAVGPLEHGFYVEDDGPGIPATQRETVFEAGYSRHADGTGLGLRIVDEIAQGHGWTVRLADSASGARFEITGAEFLE